MVGSKLLGDSFSPGFSLFARVRSGKVCCVENFPTHFLRRFRNISFIPKNFPQFFEYLFTFTSATFYLLKDQIAHVVDHKSTGTAVQSSRQCKEEPSSPSFPEVVPEINSWFKSSMWELIELSPSLQLVTMLSSIIDVHL